MHKNSIKKQNTLLQRWEKTKKSTGKTKSTVPPLSLRSTKEKWEKKMSSRSLKTQDQLAALFHEKRVKWGRRDSKNEPVTWAKLLSQKHAWNPQHTQMCLLRFDLLLPFANKICVSCAAPLFVLKQPTYKCHVRLPERMAMLCSAALQEREQCPTSLPLCVPTNKKVVPSCGTDSMPLESFSSKLKGVAMRRVTRLAVLWACTVLSKTFRCPLALNLGSPDCRRLSFVYLLGPTKTA